jgi:hypothetical protein
VSAQVRADRAGTEVDHTQAADASEAVFKWRLWRASLEAPPGPSSWRAWVRMFEEMERNVNGGAQGVADEAFYASAYRYLERHRAPPPVRSVVDFYHGLATWNFAAVAYASERLIGEHRRGRQWIAGDELRDGAVVARLKLGDPRRARRLFGMLAGLSGRPHDGVQSRLLESHIREAEGD